MKLDLEYLKHYWGDVYRLYEACGWFIAIRRDCDNLAYLKQTPDELLQAIREDYRKRPRRL